jgi:hypothetical protein
MNKTTERIIKTNLPYIPESSKKAAEITKKKIADREDKIKKEKEDARAGSIRGYRKTKYKWGKKPSKHNS